MTPHIRTRKEEIWLKARRPDWRARRPDWSGPPLGGRGLSLVAQPQPRDLIRWSKKDENHLALLMLASGLIASKTAPRVSKQLL